MSLQGAFHHWFNVASLASERGMQALGNIGRANIRADVGGIFLAIGLFAFLAAWRQSEQWALAGMIALAGAISGRIVSIALDGANERALQPIAIEALVLLIFGYAYWTWKKAPEGL